MSNINVNVCPRLLDQKIKDGYNFFYSSGNELPKGVFSKKTFQSGDIIHVLIGRIIDSPNRESIHIGNNEHIIDSYGSYINHSFDSNAKIEGKNVVAIKDIGKYEEITFNYNDSEINMACPFELDNIKVCGKQLD